jgi:hypothetical protein
MGDDFVLRISSANDRVHAMRSNHYKNLAIDIATTNEGINYQQGLRIKNLIRQKLGADFRVIYGTDRDHMNHMHFDYTGKPWDEEKILSLMVVESSKKYGVDPAIVMAIIKVASGFDHNHESEGEMGLMGLTKSVCIKLKIDNPYDPFANIVGGIRHLQDMLNLYHNDLEVALAAYKYGSEKIEMVKREYWKIPDLRFFVDNVIIFYSDYQNQGYRPI